MTLRLVFGGMAESLGSNKGFTEAVCSIVGDEQWIELKNWCGLV